MKVLYGVTTFNRLTELRKMSRSLLECSEIDRCELVVFDDHSSEYDIDQLRELFPRNARVLRNNVNIGASKNMRQVFEYFLGTDCDVLILADSDLIFHPNHLDFVRHFFPRTNGVMSLYNSAFHQGSKEIVMDDTAFIAKLTIGGAGAVFSRARIREILHNVAPSNCYDWDWCRYLNHKGIDIFVSKRSWVQHVGMKGENTNGVTIVDFGVNFLPGSEHNLFCLIDFFETSLLENYKAIAKGVDHIVAQKVEKIRLNLHREVQNSAAYRVGSFFVAPLRWIRRAWK